MDTNKEAFEKSYGTGSMAQFLYIYWLPANRTQKKATQTTCYQWANIDGP
jgi:hypothetical protein